MSDIRDFGELMREEEQKALDIEKPKIQAELDAWHALPQEEKDRRTKEIEDKYDREEQEAAESFVENECSNCGTIIDDDEDMCDECQMEDGDDE